MQASKWIAAKVRLSPDKGWESGDWQMEVPVTGPFVFVRRFGAGSCRRVALCDALPINPGEANAS